MQKTLAENSVTPKTPKSLRKAIRNAWQVIKKITIRTVKFFLISVMGFLLLAIFALYFSFTQTIVTQQVLKYLTNNSGFEMTLASLDIDWLGAKATLKELSIRDLQKKQMIFAQKININFDYQTVLQKGNITLEKVEVDQASINLAIDAETKQLNIVDFSDTLAHVFANIIPVSSSPKKKRKSSASIKLIIKQIVLKDNYFGYDDNRSEPFIDHKLFDYNHFGLDNIYLKASQFLQASDTTQIQVDMLKAKELGSNWPVHHISTFFRVFNKEMQFWKLNCKVGKSHIKDEILFKYFRMGHLASFNDKVGIVARMKETVVHSEDLARFDYYFKDMHDVVTVSGKVVGRVVRFKGRDMDVKFGKTSFIKGDFLFDGLPEVDATQMDLYFEDSNILASDLSIYSQSPSTDSILQKFGHIKYKGTFVGSIKDFKAQGTVNTDLGTIFTDAKFQLHNNEALSAYAGKIETKKLNLGKLVNRPELFQNLDMKGQIKGVGFSTKNAQFTLNALIKNLGVNGYNYQNIQVDGDLGKKRFNGKLTSLDPNFHLDMQGEINFGYKDSTNNRLPQGKFNLISNIEHIDFQAIGLSTQPAKLSGKLVLDIYGLNLDSLMGKVNLSNARFLYKNKVLTPQEAITFSSFETMNHEGHIQRTIDISSDYLSGHLKGNFQFSQLIRDIPELRHEYLLSLQNNTEIIQQYYKDKKEKKNHTYNLGYNFTLNNINPLISLFEIDASISPNVNFEGYLVQDTAFTITTIHTTDNIPQISYQNYQLFDTRIDLSSRRQIDSSNVFAEFYISSQKQNFAGIATDSLLITTRWQKDSIDFSVNLAQIYQILSNEKTIRNFVKLAGGAKISPHQVDISFKDSRFDILNKGWRILDSNLISWQDSSIVVKDLLIKRNKKQTRTAYLSLNGRMSYDEKDTLSLDINNIRVAPFAKLARMNANGLLRSTFKIYQAYENLQVKGESYLYNLMIDSMLIGDIMGNNLSWNNATQKIGIDLDVYRRSMHPMLSLYGTYSPFGRSDQRFDLSTRLQGLNLLILKPFVKPYLSKLGGSANGRLKLLGSINKPILEGNVKVVNGTFKINYLGSRYYFADDIYFKKNEVGVKKLTLYDNWNKYQDESKDSYLTIKGGIYHDYFQNFLMALEGKFNKLQAINKPPLPNETFYGEAYASGNLKITGYLGNMVELKVNATSEKGTKLYLPLDGYTEVSKNNYIKFVNFSDTLKKDLTSVKKVDLNGFKMDFNLDLNDNAQFEIIFDAQAGDLIRASGNGKLNVEMDEQGDFSIFGDYIISKGTYNFTLLNLINKGFDINTGSRVVFNGDLYDSEINIGAAYQRNVSLAPLINFEQLSDPQNPEYRRRYPVDVLLNLQGKLLSPDIRLDIDLGDASKIPNTNLRSAIRNLRSTIRTDDQELNRQVFSVLVLQRLSPRNTFTSFGAATGSSLTELLSNQLSNWVSQVDKNLELTLDLDPSALNAAQLNLSYSLLDGRLRISRAGGFTNTQNQTDVANVLGEWTIEYMLSTDGRFRAKMYNKNNQNLTNNISLVNSSSTTAGFSLLFTESFSSLGNLLRFRKNKKNKRFRKKAKKQREKNSRKTNTSNPNK